MNRAIRRWSLLIVAAAALLAITAGPLDAQPASDAAGAVGLRLLDSPADTSDPRAQLYVIDHVAPGDAIERRLEISNTSAAPIEVELYPAAADVRDGAFVGAAARTANDLSSWTTVTPADVQVDAQGQTTGAVTIDVPRDAAPGEHYGVVWAQVTSASPNAGGVTEVSRVGIRVYLSVGQGGAPATDFAIESLTAARDADGAPELRASVRNTGGRAVDLTGTITLADGPGGLRAGPFEVSLGTTLEPGRTEHVRASLDDQLPNGPWTVEIAIRSGLVEHRAQAEISFPAAGAATVVEATPERSPSRLMIMGIALVLVGAVALTWTARRRRTSL